MLEWVAIPSSRRFSWLGDQNPGLNSLQADFYHLSHQQSPGFNSNIRFNNRCSSILFLTSAILKFVFFTKVIFILLRVVGSLRVGHDWATSLWLFTFTHWRRKWQPTPVFLPGESQGRGSLMGWGLWGHRVGHGWSDLAAAAVSEHFIVKKFASQLWN